MKAYKQYFTIWWPLCISIQHVLLQHRSNGHIEIFAKNSHSVWWQTLPNFTPLVLSLVAYWLVSVSLIAVLLPLWPWLLPVDKCIELIALAESSCRYPDVQISMDYIRFSKKKMFVSVPQAKSRWFTTPLFYNYVNVWDLLIHACANYTIGGFISVKVLKDQSFIFKLWKTWSSGWSLAPAILCSLDASDASSCSLPWMIEGLLDSLCMSGLASDDLQ